MSAADQDDDDIAVRQLALRQMSYPDALVQGKDVYEYFGRRVIEHTTASGRTLAIKLMSLTCHSAFDANRSEAAMMHYAATHGVRAPKVYGVYDIVTTRPKEPIAVAMVSEKMPGERLADVWQNLDEPTKCSFKTQLREQIDLMRACTSITIGRLSSTPTYNPYERLATT